MAHHRHNWRRLTVLQQHKEDWSKGCGHTCCGMAKKIVFCRGTIPCDVLFIGEGPGESENITGRPFVGPAGKMLDHIVEWSIGRFNNQRELDGKEILTVAFTNIVGCIPRDEDNRKAIAPSEEQMEACKPRLEEFIEICMPKLIVAVGKDAQGWLAQGYLHSVKLPKLDDGSKPKIMGIYHPSYILRLPKVGQGDLIDECIVNIEDMVEKVFSEKEDRVEHLRGKYKGAEKKWKKQR